MPSLRRIDQRNELKVLVLIECELLGRVPLVRQVNHDQLHLSRIRVIVKAGILREAYVAHERVVNHPELADLIQVSIDDDARILQFNLLRDRLLVEGEQFRVKLRGIVHEIAVIHDTCEPLVENALNIFFKSVHQRD